MANKRVRLEGIIMWAKVFESNRDKEGYEGAWLDTDGRCTVNMLLDDDNYKKLQSSGTAKRGKPQDGLMNVRFERKFATEHDWQCGPPVVLKADGNDWDEEVDGYIGNGSFGRVELDVYTGGKFASTRLDILKVLDAAPYEGGESEMKKDESEKYGGSAVNKETAKEDTPEELDDEIPF